MSSKVALALGSGGARGYAHIPVIQWLLERGVEVEAVCGSSAGALIGAHYCLRGEVESLYGTARELRDRRFRDILDPDLPHRSLLKGRRFHRWLERHYGGASFSDAKIPLTVCATDLGLGREVLFREGDIALAVRASCAFPGYFAPQRVGGRLLSDGGILQPVPYAPLLASGHRKVIGVNLTSAGPVARPGSSAVGVGMRAFWLALAKLSKPPSSACFEVAPKFRPSLPGMFEFSKIEAYSGAGARAIGQSENHLLRWLDEGPL